MTKAPEILKPIRMGSVQDRKHQTIQSMEEVTDSSA